MVIINPDENEVNLLKEKQLKFLIREKKLLDYAKLEGKTTDDHKIKVYANIELPEELELALSYGAEGIGMYRTEFLFTNSICSRGFCIVHAVQDLLLFRGDFLFIHPVRGYQASLCQHVGNGHQIV